MGAPQQQPLGLVVADVKDVNGNLLALRDVIITDQESDSPVRLYASRTSTQPIGIGELRTNSAGRVRFYAVKGRSLNIRAYHNKELIGEVGDVRPDSWWSQADSHVGEEGPPGPDEATALKEDLEESMDPSAIIQAMLDAWSVDYNDPSRARVIDLRGANLKLLRPLSLWTAGYSSIRFENGRIYPDTTQYWGVQNGQPEKSLIELRGTVERIDFQNLELDCQNACNGILNLSTGGAHVVRDCHIHNFLSWGIEDSMGGMRIEGRTKIEQYLSTDVEFLTQARRTASSVFSVGTDTTIDNAILRASRWPLKAGMDWDIFANTTIGSTVLEQVKGRVEGSTNIGSNVITGMSSTEPLRVGMALNGPKIGVGATVVKILSTTSVEMSGLGVANGVSTIEFDAASLLYPGTHLVADGIVTPTTKIDASIGDLTVRMTEPALVSSVAVPILASKGSYDLRVDDSAVGNYGPSSSPSTSMGTLYYGRESQGAILYGCRTSRGVAHLWSPAIAFLDHRFIDDPTLTSSPVMFQLKATQVNQTLAGFEFRPHRSMVFLANSSLFSLTSGTPGSSWNVAGVSGLATTVARIEHGTSTTIVDSDTFMRLKSLQTTGKIILEAIGTTTPVELKVDGNSLQLAASRVNHGGAIQKNLRKYVEKVSVDKTFGPEDSGSLYIATSSSAKTWRLAADLPPGWFIEIAKTGSGSLQLLPLDGATLDGELTGINVTGGLSVSCISNVDSVSAEFITRGP